MQQNSRVALAFGMCPSENKIKTELRSCAACGEPISDRYLLEVGGCTWHGSCLRCCVCLSPLDRQPSCFLRERQVYCKADYT
uniref:LIM zinc-binding domain-containing protein n=2 Tax=Lutzomyia longipalpis TaxID=7200 RepID=A0A1B0GH11_LUTLO